MSSCGRLLNIPPRKFFITFDKDGVSSCLNWTVKDVGEWIEMGINFPQYKACFTSNFINGKKLITINASTLPNVGVTDFKHIQIITSEIQKILGTNERKFNQTIHSNMLGLYLERKSKTGKEMDVLTYPKHVDQMKKEC